MQVVGLDHRITKLYFRVTKSEGDHWEVSSR
jgi:hypothetical protein